jgi:integrase
LQKDDRKMARPNKPWYREDRRRWYVTINGKWHNLGPDKKRAMQRFHELMAAKDAAEDRPVDRASVAAILDEFLEWTKQNRATKTYRGYVDFCQSFTSTWPRLRTDEFKPMHVQEWLNKKTTWNSTTKRGAITCLKRAMNWAARMGYLHTNPISAMEKPEAKPRTTLVDSDEFESILSEIGDDNFKDLLIVSFDTGARPQEVKSLEARHIDLDKHLWIFPRDEAKGKKKPRVVYIPTERSLAIVRKNIERHPVGPIFRNRLGNPWTGYAVKCRFARLQERLGKRYRQYDLRHSWITRQLVAGVDSHVVASLSGHSDTSMIDRVYSHVADDHRFMLAQAKRGAE